MSREWKAASDEGVFEGRDRQRANRSGPAPASTSSSVRTPNCAPLPKSMAPATRKQKFVADFVAAWNKVMNADRFDSPDLCRKVSASSSRPAC